MTIDFIIKGSGKEGKRAEVHQSNGDVGIKAFVDDLHTFINAPTAAFNPVNGIEMAVDASFSGTPDKVHDGIDSVLWTGSQITGTNTTFNSTEQANNGTNSVKTANAKVSDVYEFDKGGNITLSNYVALTFFVYVSGNWSASDFVDVYGYDTGTATAVGVSVSLGDYFNFSTFNTRHQVSIPLEDLQLESSTIDAIRFEQVAKSGQAPTYYLDDIQFEETGGSVVYKIEPDDGKKIKIYALRYTFIDNVASTVTNGTVSGMSYDKLLGVSTLANGINAVRYVDGKPTFSATFRDLRDMVSFGGFMEGAYSDGTNTMLSMEFKFAAPVTLDSRTNDSLDFTISDDLSALISFRVVALAGERDVG